MEEPADADRRGGDHRDGHQGADPEALQAQLIEPQAADHADRQVRQVDAVAAPAAGLHGLQEAAGVDPVVVRPQADQDQAERGGLDGRIQVAPVGHGQESQDPRVHAPPGPLRGRRLQPPVDGQADGELVPEDRERAREAARSPHVPGDDVQADRRRAQGGQGPVEPFRRDQQGQEADDVELLQEAERPRDPHEDHFTRESHAWPPGFRQREVAHPLPEVQRRRLVQFQRVDAPIEPVQAQPVEPHHDDHEPQQGHPVRGEGPPEPLAEEVPGALAPLSQRVHPRQDA
ncbi:hypothetical protein HK102_012748, partial [Quaeritorhiza haematococci]